MKTLIFVLVLFLLVKLLIYLVKIANNSPITCPQCKVEFKDFVVKGYDYHTEHYCPHCNYEFRG